METVSFQKSEVFKKRADTLFEEQRALLSTMFPYAEVEHIGGTAIPELLTKGDLDINVRIPKERFVDVTGQLKKDYLVNQPQNWTDTFASFKDDDSFSLPLGIQVTVRGGPEGHFLKHRDSLRNNPELVTKLNQLKQEYEGGPMDAYREAKGSFLKENIK